MGKVQLHHLSCLLMFWISFRCIAYFRHLQRNLCILKEQWTVFMKIRHKWTQYQCTLGKVSVCCFTHLSWWFTFCSKEIFYLGISTEIILSILNHNDIVLLVYILEGSILWLVLLYGWGLLSSNTKIKFIRNSSVVVSLTLTIFNL